MSPTPPRSRRPAGSVKHLAEALGVSRRRVSTLLLDGMPVDIAEAKAWRGLASDTSSTVADDSPAELRRKRIALLSAQEEKIRIEIAAKNRELLPLGEVIESTVRCITIAKARFLRLQSDLPPRLSGLSETQMQTCIRDAVVEILTELHDNSTKLYESRP